jgi:hypothetical protein
MKRCRRGMKNGYISIAMNVILRSINGRATSINLGDEVPAEGAVNDRLL